ncbi:prepilin peptidase [Crocosphaera watsonii WH 8501]|uniref:Prepilin leader peptidase/N-methyltransferase n=5 Tax=Crocosphaera watsonii TaxID=263511 RepID=Q4C2H8_CROWT|nr:MULTISPECIES: A24 family peptidase [Crocosphaera]EAM50360.1 Prepilin peptidase [Crocosphaera watsonii WH 8501]EHJ12278.1 Leader peptidase (Prepilin peptidase) / N-methyltransferase [Crocosphaera watsonii WH 0003]MCH2243796.1 prepilin peptidase [Crocosphaera sp.]NQZ60877.1 prepilin peptidase [Crocosphaera sp.]CCQ50257.1 Leader peptidase (Prepilin peptidase) / N-methyltransferase [Crocosphaera watsonii WH 8502]
MDLLIASITLPFVFVFGACIGSFLNVVIYRLPEGISLIHPPSRCPHCEHPLGKTENVPVLGWLWLRGRCRWCHTPISVRYPLIEAITGLLFCAVFWQYQFTLTTIGYWVLVSWLVSLAMIDFDTMTLPGELTKSGLILGLIFQGIIGWQFAQTPEYLMTAITSAVLGIWLFCIIRWGGTWVFGKEALGGGDSKLAAMLGAWLGWKYLLVTSFLACLLGSLFGVSGMVLGFMGRLQYFPFGPFLALGAILSLFWGEIIISTYIQAFFPLS